MPALQMRDFVSKFLQKRFPTILGLILLMLGVGAGVVLVRGGTGGFLPRASEDSVPKQIRITNINDSGFTVSFLTNLPAPGYIQYGTQENRTSIQTRDDRDQLTNQVGSFQTHHVTVRGLQPNTQYYFRIGTGSNSMFDNGGKAFAVKTASRIENLPAAKTAYGTVKNEVGNPAAGSIVYLSIDGASPLSSTVKTDGSWAIPLAGLRTNDLSGAHSLSDTTPVKVQVQGEAANVSATVDVTIAGLAPLEAITLSKGGAAPKASASPAGSPLASPITSATPVGSPSAGLGSLFTPTEGSQADTSADVELRFPLREGEVVTSVKPELSGEAPANSYLQIEIHSDPVYNGVVQTDAQGNWEWTPPGNLTPGEHTVIVTYTDAAGQQQKVQRKFIVQATGSNLPSFVSTPSAVVAPTPTPRATPSPTPVATVRPTATPVPTVAATPYIPATSSAQPVSGSPRPMVGLFTIALAFLSYGIWRMQYNRR